MTLEDAAYLSQIIAVVTVIGSLIAIYFQQRQANRIARVDMTQRVQTNYSDSLREIMGNPQLAEIFRKVMFEKSELTPVETTQILTYLNLTLSAHANAFLWMKDGMIDPRYLRDTEHNTAWYLTAPLFAREWRRVQRLGLFGRDFADYVNARVAELHPGQDPSTQAQP
jgi:hypothetical protein